MNAAAIFYFSSGNHYEGEFFDSKKQGKGINFIRTVTNMNTNG